MLNATGHMIEPVGGRYKGTLRTVSIKAEIDILPNTQKIADRLPDFHLATESIEIGAGWMHKGEASNKEYVNLSIAAPEFGPKKPFANLHGAAGSDEENLFFAIRNTGDQN